MKKTILLVFFLLVLSLSLVSAQPYEEWNVVTTWPGTVHYMINFFPMVYGDGQIFVIEAGPNFDVYNVSADSWSVASNPPYWSTKGAAYEDGVIYISDLTGAYDANVMLMYDVSNDSWSYGSESNLSGLIYPGVVAHNGLVYVMGGESTDTWYGSPNMRIYDVSNDSWSEGPQMPAGKGSVDGAVVLNDKIYVVGTDFYWDYSNEMYVYDINKGNWSTVLMPLNLELSGLATAGGFIYVVGGRGLVETDFLLRYSPVNDSWDIFNVPYYDLYWPGVAYTDDTIWFLGGAEGSGNVYEYKINVSAYEGCIDSDATNFDSNKTIDDGSCEYESGNGDGNGVIPSPSRGGGGGAWPEDSDKEDVEENETGAPLLSVVGEGDTLDLPGGLLVAFWIFIAGLAIYFGVQMFKSNNRRGKRK